MFVREIFCLKNLQSLKKYYTFAVPMLPQCVSVKISRKIALDFQGDFFIGKSYIQKIKAVLRKSGVRQPAFNSQNQHYRRLFIMFLRLFLAANIRVLTLVNEIHRISAISSYLYPFSLRISTLI